MSDGGNYIKLYRGLLDNPLVMKDADYLAVWIWLLLNARFNDHDVMFGGKVITLNPGELTTGRKRIADELHISESKVQRILKNFESENMIEQRTNRQSRLISIVSWNKYQQSEQRVNNDFCEDSVKISKNVKKVNNKVNNEVNNERGAQNVENSMLADVDRLESEQQSEQPFEQRLNNERTTIEQRVNTNKERKERKKEKNVNNSSCCSNARAREVKSVLSLMSDGEIEKIFETYDEAYMLIDEVDEELALKKKFGEIENAYRYVIGYAKNVNWRRTGG